MQTKRFSDEEKQELLTKIKANRKEGMSFKAACSDVGVSYQTVYAWQSKNLKKKTKSIVAKARATARALPVVHNYHLSEKDDDQVTILIGKASTVKANLETLLELRRLH